MDSQIGIGWLMSTESVHVLWGQGILPPRFSEHQKVRGSAVAYMLF